jgi:tRNA 2-thiouridine synthesizing protein C
MTNTAAKRILFVNRKAPHSSLAAKESLDAVLTAAAFAQKIALLFLDDGIFQLLAGQATEAIQQKDVAKAFAALSLYDVNDIYVDQQSLTQRGITAAELIIPVTTLSAAEITALCEAQDAILSF